VKCWREPSRARQGAATRCVLFLWFSALCCPLHPHPILLCPCGATLYNWSLFIRTRGARESIRLRGRVRPPGAFLFLLCSPHSLVSICLSHLVVHKRCDPLQLEFSHSCEALARAFACEAGCGHQVRLVFALLFSHFVVPMMYYLISLAAPFGRIAPDNPPSPDPPLARGKPSFPTAPFPSRHRSRADDPHQAPFPHLLGA
jgi:hypothetical protein